MRRQPSPVMLKPESLAHFGGKAETRRYAHRRRTLRDQPKENIRALSPSMSKGQREETPKPSSSLVLNGAGHAGEPGPLSGLPLVASPHQLVGIPWVTKKNMEPEI